jgi:hypothetical protein
MKRTFLLFFFIMGVAFSAHSYESIGIIDVDFQAQQPDCIDCSYKFNPVVFCPCNKEEGPGSDIAIIALDKILKDEVPIPFFVLKENEKFFNVTPSCEKGIKIIARKKGTYIGDVSFFSEVPTTDPLGVFIKFVLKGVSSTVHVPVNILERLEITLDVGDSIEFLGSNTNNSKERVVFLFTLNRETSTH